MAEWLLLTTHFVSAAALIALASWLLWLKVDSPVNRSLALFLFLRGMVSVVSGLFRLADTNQMLVALGAFREYLLLALAPAMAYFVVVYAVPRGRLQTFLRGAVVLVALTLQGLYTWDHCLATCSTPESPPGGALGPLSVVSLGWPFLATGLGGLFLAIDARRSESVARRNATFLVAAGFLLITLLESGFLAGFVWAFGWAETIQTYGGALWPQVALSLWLGGFAPAIAAAGVLWGTPDVEHRTAKLRNLVAAMAVAVLIGVGAGGLLGTWGAAPFLLVAGVLRVVLPVLIVYAVVRHRLFGIEVKVQFAIKQSTVVGVFAAIVFVVSELIEQVFDVDQTIPALGTAAVIALALKPMQVLGDRIARAAMPGARAISDMDERARVALFRDQAELVWSDGQLGRRERAVLDQLRDRLRIPADAAATIEHDAAMAAPPPPSVPNSGAAAE